MAELALTEGRAFTEPLAEWAVRRITLEGRPFRFDGHDYLRAIYDDRARHICLSKAAQIGGSVWAMLRCLHACLSGLNAVFYLPTRTDALDFSKSRVRPLLAENEFLRDRMTDTITAGLMRVGEGFFYLRGMQSNVGVKSVPADMLVFDELDETPPEMKALAKERLAHSEFKRVIELSNPSLPDYGIDEVYQRSDQRHWQLHCPSCASWTALEREFPLKLGEEVRIILPRAEGGFYRACPKCTAELDPARGEWVADFPDREIHGYRISQLFSARVDPGEILREYRSTRFPDRFYHLKIGVPWADLERRLDEASVLARCSDEPMYEAASDPCTMGVDTGRALHVVILRPKDRGSDVQQVVWLQECYELGQLDTLIERYRVERCVIDGMPETHATREFARRHRNKVFLCFFVESARGGARWDNDAATVGVNRTEALDASRAAVRNKEVVLPRRQPIVEEFARHMAADAKILDEDEQTGAQRYRYVRTGPDHYSLAFTYAWLAATHPSPNQALLDWYRRQAAIARGEAPDPSS